MNKTLAIIDIDGLFYQSSKETLEESISNFGEKLNNIFEQTKATHYVAFCSFSPYFRHEIDKEYKQHRKKYKSPLKWIKTLKSYAIEKYGVQWMKNVEADDLCAYWMNKELSIAIDDGKIEPKEVFDETLDYCVEQKLDLFKFEPMEVILCTPDKDLLQSIPGKHFNYTYKLKDEIKELVRENPSYETKEEDVIKGFWVETTDDESEDFQKMQLLVGDSSDNIKGVEKKGIKYWEKMVKNNENLYTKILSEYFLKYGISQGIYNFQKNFRLLHLLQTDEDFFREIGHLPEMPEIYKINQLNEIENLNDEKLPNFD